jgi:plasmid maintenance system antidote protein VapI
MIATESSRADAAATVAPGDRLSRYLGPGGAFSMNLQSQYDLAMAEKRLGAKIRAEVEAA